MTITPTQTRTSTVYIWRQDGARPASAGRAPAARPRSHPPASADGSDGPLLRLLGVGKHFGPVQALTDIDLDIPAGQVTALVGDNGAGKSTLIKCIAGIWAPSEGQIIWKGRPVQMHTPKDATELGIATVYQDLALCDNLDIVQNMLLGHETLRHGLLDEIIDGEGRQADPRRPACHHGAVGPPARRLAVRRPAAGGRGGQGGDAGRQAGHHGRAHRRARRDPDRTGAEPDRAAGQPRASR